ncbi:MAG TPA: plastocyanin/azurin family copper-binding protein [Solirubrobacterales bacterium]|nr:plastocyanin/azurin family copper-binding protein [Solirubrobacterales bacterium]
MRRTPIVALVLIVSLVFASEAMAATTVRLGDNFFAPSSKTIARGAKVRFKWIGNRPHNVKKRRGPGGGFKSRTTSRRGVNFAKKFRKRGAYKLICTIHPETMRMTLRVR